jgi:hypothetical protein
MGHHGGCLCIVVVIADRANEHEQEGLSVEDILCLFLLSLHSCSFARTGGHRSEQESLRGIEGDQDHQKVVDSTKHDWICPRSKENMWHRCKHIMLR